MNITTPTLVLDKERCIRNIEKIVKKVKGTSTEVRPHFKTHQSIEIGRWYKKYGTDKITVSSLEMASYFSEDWDDITVAFPINVLEVETINELASRIKLNLLAVGPDALYFLADNLTAQAGICIKVDVGTHRTGVNPGDTASIDRLLDIIDSSDKMYFKGFLGHAGHSYGSRSKEEILRIHEQGRSIMAVLRTHYQTRYPDLIISLGDTPTCSVATDFEGIDEIRPGNYVLYDIMQEQIGSCTYDEVAAAVACPIVAIHPERNEMIIYGGGVHFSKDSIKTDHGTSYGHIVTQDGNGWGNPIEGMYVKGLSQEHGKIAVPSDRINDYQVGGLLYILPVHSCMTADLLKVYTTTDGDKITMMNSYR